MTYRIIGQERIQQLLLSALAKNRLAHAYLFHGQAGTGKDAVALGLALHLVCQENVNWGCGKCPACRQVLNLEHPAYKFIAPVPSRPKAVKEDKYLEILRERMLGRLANPYWPIDYNPELSTLPVISIDQIRGMKQEVMLKLSGSGYRIFHVSQIDRMTEAAANSLLKLLEEPPQRTLLILTTSHPSRILETIHSRCQNIHFQGMAPETLEKAFTGHWEMESGKARFLARMAGGSLQRGLQMADEEFESQRQMAIAFLELCFGDNLLPILDWVESQSATSAKAQTVDIIRLLQTLIRDLHQLQLGFEARVIHSDTLPLLRSFRDKHPGFQADIALGATSQTIDYIEKNAYLPLALFSLFRQLRQANKKV